MIQTSPKFREFIEPQLETELSKKAVFIGNITKNGGGVVAFDSYDGEGIELFFAGKQLFTRSFIAVIFNYVFNQLKCHRCTVRCKAGNDKAISIVKRMGFVHEGTIREALDKQDVLVYGMLHSECRYLNYGKKIKTRYARASRPNGNAARTSTVQQI